MLKWYNLKKFFLLYLAIAIIMSVTGCSARSKLSEDNYIDEKLTTNKSSQESSKIVQKSSAQSDNKMSSSKVESERITTENEASEKLDEFGVPVMSKNNQVYFDKYIRIFSDYSPFPVFLTNFNEKTCSSFYADQIYSALTSPSEAIEVDQETVESLVKEYFSVSSENMRKYSGRSYLQDKESYFITPKGNGDNIIGVLTDSVLDSTILTLTCDWYESHTPGKPNSYELKYKSATKIRIDSNEKWFYISNVVN